MRQITYRETGKTGNNGKTEKCPPVVISSLIPPERVYIIQNRQTVSQGAQDITADCQCFPNRETLKRKLKQDCEAVAEEVQAVLNLGENPPDHREYPHLEGLLQQLPYKVESTVKGLLETGQVRESDLHQQAVRYINHDLYIRSNPFSQTERRELQRIINKKEGVAA